MNSTERVRNTILGKETDRQPIYGWVSANLTNQISAVYGSVAAFEDKYEYDAAHLFGGPGPYNWELIDKLRSEEDEVTPDMLCDRDDLFTSPDIIEQYSNIKDALAFHKKRDRFCYIQTPGFFEPFNEVFGIENHLMYLALYPDEVAELYRKQAEWIKKFAGHCIDIGVDMVHMSDDWGAQKDLMFSPDAWWKLIYPNAKNVVDYVHNRGCFASLHSDGYIEKVVDGVEKIGYNVVHPWQETAGMSYELYLEKYQNSFGILGGVCVQSLLGIVGKEKIESEIKRVFSLLRHKRWICCTTHFVQDHCSIEDLTFAYDLIYKLARES